MYLLKLLIFVPILCSECYFIKILHREKCKTIRFYFNILKNSKQLYASSKHKKITNGTPISKYQYSFLNTLFYFAG